MWNSKSWPEGIPIQKNGSTARKLTAASSKCEVGNLSGEGGMKLDLGSEMAVCERDSTQGNSIAIAEFSEN
jgi:hypothetical protein